MNQTDSRSTNLGEDGTSSRKRLRAKLEKLLILTCITLVTMIAAGAAILISTLRENTLVDTERELENVALILAEQTERTFQAIVLVQNSIAEQVHLLGIETPEEFDLQMESIQAHQRLRDKVSGLPFIDTVAVLSAEGRLINFSRFWPMPNANFSDRSYFTAPMADPGVGWHLSEPIQSRITGQWTIYVSRKIAASNGAPLGVVSAAITLEQFDKFFASIALTRDSSIALFRLDGTLLVRHPPVPASVGRNLSQQPILRSLLAKPTSATLRAVGALDGRDRIFAAHRLKRFPIGVVVTTTMSTALADWRLQATAIGVAGALALTTVIVVFVLILRELRRRQDRAQKEMAAQKLQLDVALDHMSQGLCMYDARGRLVVCNDRFLQMLGLSRDVVRPGAGMWTVLKHAQESGSLSGDSENFEQYEAGLEAGKIDEVLETKDGRVIRTARLPIASGGWVVTFEDITERRLAELDRDRNRAFLDRVIDNIPSIVFVKDAATRRFVLINKAGEQLWGLPRSEIVGRTVAELFPRDRAEAITRFEEQLLAADRDLFFDEHPFTSAIGTLHHVTARATCIRSASGAPQYVLGVIEDVTERRLVRQQLQQAQRMEAVGRLTGGLAHDFNNLLLIMVGNLDLLARDVQGDPAAAEKVETILQASLRGAELTRQLLAFSRRQPLAPRRLQANDLIRHTANLLQRTLGQDITIELDLASQAHPVTADEAQLEAALVNIAINARDAMPNGGKLLIATRNTQFDQDYCDKHSEIVPGDYVGIEITDTGTGMPPDVLSRIYEPFFTTKPAGVGTGLGLSTVFGFMRQSGGHIEASSEVGIGTTFRLYLPRADEHATDPGPYMASPALAPDRTPDETIVVVEDNPEIRTMVAAQLTGLGYRAVEADDAFDALEKLETTGADLLFTDMVMPGDMNGKQLATIARFKHPGLKVLFTSGFPGTADFLGTELEPSDVLLKKPYRTADLARALRTVLDGGADEDSEQASADMR